MRLQFTGLLLLLLICTVNAQKINDTVYFNSKWEESVENNYTYYRIIESQDKLYKITDYWKTGEVQMTGTYKSLDPKIQHGEFFWYHKNGSLRQFTEYNDGRAIGLISEYNLNGDTAFTYVVDIECLDNSDQLLKHLKKFRKRISKSLQYPPYCQENTIDGKVVTDFFIGSGGQIKRLKVVESVHEKLDNEAKRVIKSYDKWPEPLYKGRTTNLYFRFPIIFVL